MEIPCVTVMEVQEGSNKVLILFILILVICLIVGGMFEIVIRTCNTHTNREIKESHNIEKIKLNSSILSRI